MVQKWTLCIEVSCYPNLGKAIIAYILYNNATNKVFQRKNDVCGRTTSNEAYYIALIEGLKTTKEHGANDIVVFTNSELVCNQMKGTYRVRKDNLKLLHSEVRISASQFHSFTIHHHRNIERLSSDLLSVAMSTIGGGRWKINWHQHLFHQKLLIGIIIVLWYVYVFLLYLFWYL